MGIFSDRCVDPECPGRVPKAAKFCRLCGSAAVDADTNCGRCGAVVSTSSKFCWRCGADLEHQKKTPLFDNRWVRDADDFAIRVDECDVKGFLAKGLVIEHGTNAMLFQQGRFCNYIEPGSYDLNGFMKKVNHFNQTSPSSVVLYDAGDVELHLETLKLHSREQMEVDAIFKAMVRLNDPEKLFTNAFKSRNRLTVGYLAGSLTDELRAALQTDVGGTSVQELYNNASLRPEVERQMQIELEPILERIGLEMIQLRFVDFFCVDYDPIREKEAELYVDTREKEVDIDRLKLTQRLRKELTAEKMHEFKSENDLEGFVRQTEHELGLRDVVRSDEIARLRLQFAQGEDISIVTHGIEVDGIRNDADREEARRALDARLESMKKERAADREERTADATTDRTIRAGDHDQDIKEASDALELQRQVKSIEQEEAANAIKNEGLRLKQFDEVSAQALIGILDGPAADRIARLEELRVKKELTPEQIVALAASDNPAIANTLAEKYRAEAAMSDARFDQLQEFMGQQQQSSADAADRLERVMNVAMQQMGTTATTRAQAPGAGGQTVVAGGGGPVVVSGQGATTVICCPKCRESIPAGSRFCPNCREKL